MAPQIKQDLNRSGWETTDFPSVCESCLPDNPYVQMIKENHGSECKLCTRPFTLFRWKADRTARTKRTNICLTCARLKNCCQCCMLDLSFGLPIVIRDAALKMVAPGPNSDVNREYYAQENEKELEEGRGGLEEYEKTDEKARELLRRLANSEPYQRRRTRNDDGQGGGGDGSGSGVGASRRMIEGGPGPVRTGDTRGRGAYAGSRGIGRGGRGGARGGRGGPSMGGGAGAIPGPDDIRPPRDPHVTSLFITGVEDDLPEHAIRKFFTDFGTLRSVVCSHRAHCAFINYATRESAEKAAESCQGRAVIAGCPLRVQWGKPKPLDNMEQDVRMMHARQGRETAAALVAASKGPALASGSSGTGAQVTRTGTGDDLALVAPPPGQEDVQYASLAGD